MIPKSPRISHRKSDFCACLSPVMRTDALVYEVHRIPSEKGEIETMPGRSYDEIVLVDPPPHDRRLIAPCRLTAPFFSNTVSVSG